MRVRAIVVSVVALVLISGVGRSAERAATTTRARADPSARADLAKTAYESWSAKQREKSASSVDGEMLYRWSKRWMLAELETTTSLSARVAVAERHLDRMLTYARSLHSAVRQDVDRGQLAAAVYCVDEARAIVEAVEQRQPLPQTE